MRNKTAHYNNRHNGCDCHSVLGRQCVSVRSYQSGSGGLVWARRRLQLSVLGIRVRWTNRNACEQLCGLVDQCQCRYASIRRFSLVNLGICEQHELLGVVVRLGRRTPSRQRRTVRLPRPGDGHMGCVGISGRSRDEFRVSAECGTTYYRIGTAAESRRRRFWQLGRGSLAAGDAGAVVRVSLNRCRRVCLLDGEDSVMSLAV